MRNVRALGIFGILPPGKAAEGGTAQGHKVVELASAVWGGGRLNFALSGKGKSTQRLV